jgi:hypothetical protein
MIIGQILCFRVLLSSNSCIFNLNPPQPLDTLYQTWNLEVYFVHVLICGVTMLLPYKKCWLMLAIFFVKLNDLLHHCQKGNPFWLVMPYIMNLLFCLFKMSYVHFKKDMLYQCLCQFQHIRNWMVIILIGHCFLSLHKKKSCLVIHLGNNWRHTPCPT